MTTVLRPAQPGDTFVLLRPDSDEAEQVRLRQHTLQARLGGQIHEPAHLTCQRFDLPPGHQIDDVLPALRTALRAVKPFALTAVGFIPLYSRFRQSHILKWCVQETNDLRQLGATLESVLVTTSATPHFRYSLGWVSTLITALEGIPDMPDDRNLDPSGFPHHLFVARQVVVSRLRKNQEFEIVQEFPLVSEHELLV